MYIHFSDTSYKISYLWFLCLNSEVIPQNYIKVEVIRAKPPFTWVLIPRDFSVSVFLNLVGSRKSLPAQRGKKSWDETQEIFILLKAWQYKSGIL